MIFRRATVLDIPNVSSLWKTTFGDSERFIARFISFFGVETCYVCEFYHEIIAIAFALPTQIRFKAYYIYACATHPQHQKQGIMKKLLEKIYHDACCENVQGIFLYAANKNVANYYRKLGFEDFFYRKEILYDTSQLNAKIETSPNSYFEITPEEYYIKRRKKLYNLCFVDWNKDFFQFIQKEELHFCEYEDSIFSYKLKEDAIVVEELLGKMPADTIAHLLIANSPDIKTINFRLPGSDVCCGQMKWCKSSDRMNNNDYFAFAME